ncbi:MAG: general secretion pathway protein GspB [Arenimonas sp.]
MSLILDALKKSEAERQRGQTPNLLSPLPSASRETQANTKSGLPWLIVVLLFIVILIIGFFYLKDKTQASTVTTPVPATEVSRQTTVAEPIKNQPSVTAAPVPAPIEKPDPAINTAAAPVPANPTSAPAPTIETPPDIVEPEPVARIASLSEMSAEQRQQLPTLKLSMHVYSAEAGKRFAIIDGQRVNEGSVLGSAVIEQIRQDGVVLSVQGQTYLLPRP